MNGMVIPINRGRMGNFLFQAACAAAYAWKHDMEFTVPSRTVRPQDNPIYLQHLVNPKWDPQVPFIKIKEKEFTYQELPWDDSWRRFNIRMEGWWQTEKYFMAYRARLLKAFGFPWTPYPGVVSVHVRRGDYLRLTKKHPPVTQRWYEEAMARFQGYQFFFFSDDLDWCRATFGHRRDCLFSRNKNEVDDLVEMSWCEHHICSASTFSWWGAWLNQNPNKRVLIPTLWFQPGHGGLDTSDIVPPEWEKV